MPDHKCVRWKKGRRCSAGQETTFCGPEPCEIHDSPEQKRIAELEAMLSLGVLSWEEPDPFERSKLMELWCSRANELLEEE